MMFGQQINSSFRLVMIVGLAVIVAIASFANSVAMVIGFTAATFAAGVVIIIVTGAFVSLSRDKSTDDHLLASSNSLSGDEIG
jgi:hypothetical protein